MKVSQRMKVRNPARYRLAQGLPAPTVDQAPDGVLDLEASSRGATVRPPGSLFPEEGDEIGLRFGDYVWPRQPFGDQYQAFQLPVAEVGRHLGQDVIVAYGLLRQDVFYPSDTLPVHVPNFVENDNRLVTPLIAEALGDLLSLQAFEGDATLGVAPWLLISTGQRVWLDVVVNTESHEYALTLLSGETVTEEMVTAGFETNLSRTDLDAIATGARLTPRLRVAFDGAPNDDNALLFPTLEYTLTRDAIRLFTDFTDEPPSPLDAPRWLTPGLLLTATRDGMRPNAISNNSARPPIEGTHLKVSGAVEFTIQIPVARFELDLFTDGRTRFDVYGLDGVLFDSFVRAPTPEDPNPSMTVEYVAAQPFMKLGIVYTASENIDAQVDRVTFST